MHNSYNQNDSYPNQLDKIKDIKLRKEENFDFIKQQTSKNQSINPRSIIYELKSHAHIIGEIHEGKINFFNRRLKKCFPYLSRKEIIQILYFYSLLQIDKDHALPILKRAKTYFENSEDLFRDIEEPEFRKLIIAKRYFDVLGFTINITHHTNYQGYLANLKKWVIKKRTQSSAQKYVKKIIKPYLTDIEEESYLDVACDCVDLFSCSSNLILEVDSHEFHSLNKNATNPKVNLITQLKTYLLEKHGFNLIRLDVEKIKNEGRSYILNKIEPFIHYELELLQNDYIQENYENGGKCSYHIIETNGVKRHRFLDCLSPFIYTYQCNNPHHQGAMSTWMTSLLKNMKCPTCNADQFINYLSDLAKLSQFNTTMKDATSEYFIRHPEFLKTVVDHSNMIFELFEFQNFISFFDACVKIKLPLNEKIVENWCMFVEPSLQEVETAELENILKLFIALKIKPPKEFTDVFFNAIQKKIPTLHVQNIINLLSQLTFFNRTPPEQWIKGIIKHLTPLLKYLTSSSLFSLPKNICIKGILNDESFAREWFSVSAQNMPHVNIDILINSTLYSLHKFEAEIPLFWFSAFSQKILKNFDSLKIYSVAHLLQGLSYTFVNPKLIEDVLNACQNFITIYDAPTYDKISLNDLNKIIPAINYFNLRGLTFSLSLEKYQHKIQSLLTPEDYSNQSNALLTEYVREYFDVVEQNKPIEQILRCVNLYIHSCNLVILISNEKNQLRTRLNAEILRFNKYNVIFLSKEKFKNLGKDYVDFEINKYLTGNNNGFVASVGVKSK